MIVNAGVVESSGGRRLPLGTAERLLDRLSSEPLVVTPLATPPNLRAAMGSRWRQIIAAPLTP